MLCLFNRGPLLVGFKFGTTTPRTCVGTQGKTKGFFVGGPRKTTSFGFGYPKERGDQKENHQLWEDPSAFSGAGPKDPVDRPTGIRNRGAADPAPLELEEGVAHLTG